MKGIQGGIHDNNSGWEDDKICIGHVSDSEGSVLNGVNLNPKNWSTFYGIVLCSRLGLYCYNFQNGMCELFIY